MESKKKLNIFKYTLCAIMAALLCIFAPMSIPIGPIPISLTTFVLYFIIFIIGTRGSLISLGIYLLLGIVGLPVFSGYAGGIAKIAGPTGGYIIGYIPMVLISGLCYNFFRKKHIAIDIIGTTLGMIVGTAVLYLLGTIWFVIQMKTTVAYAMTVCVIPFISGDIIKIVIANILGRAVRIPLVKAGFITKGDITK